MPKTSPERIIYCREWRKLTYDQKRFNKCIREYIEVKYGTIFNEFKQFYRDLDQNNPGSKDITKTRVKLWKKNGKTQQNGSDNQILQAQQNDSDNQILQAQQNGSENQILQAQQNDSDNQILQAQQNGSENQILQAQQNDSDNQILQAQQNDSDNQILQVQHDQSDSDDLSDSQSDSGNQNDILNQAMNGPLSPDHMSIDQMDDLLQEMISDLQQDDDIRALLNDEELFPNIQEDEGIDLDITVEIDESELLW